MKAPPFPRTEAEYRALIGFDEAARIVWVGKAGEHCHVNERRRVPCRWVPR